jgi:gluconolactonase
MKAAFAWLVIASGFQFPEGPVWGPDGKLYLSSCNTPAVCRVEAKDKWIKYREIGCNGLAFDAEGALIVCNPDLKGKPRHPRLLRIDKNGNEQVLADEFDGRPLNGPNDLTIGPHGTIYFTDPCGDPKEYAKGAVYRLTKDGKLSRIARSMRYPNGIELDPVGSCLLVASTVDKAIYQIPLGVRGKPSERPKWCDLAPLGEMVGPDGMTFDEEGNLYVAVFGAGMVVKIDPSGRIVQQFKTPGKNPTNCCFGGKDYKTLYVTETQRNELLAAEMPVPGLRPSWQRTGTTRSAKEPR